MGGRQGAGRLRWRLMERQTAGESTLSRYSLCYTRREYSCRTDHLDMLALAASGPWARVGRASAVTDRVGQGQEEEGASGGCAF
jgi:hypothetical protein